MITFLDLLCAKQSLEKLASTDLPLQKAYSVYKTVEQVNKMLLFYANERNKLNDDESIEKLNRAEIPEEIAEIEIPISTDIKLTASDINYLKPFIAFKEY